MQALDFSSLRRRCALALLLAAGTAALAAADSVELVSRVDPGGFSDTAAGAGNHPFYPPSISRDGRYVAFLSAANNLVPGQSDRNANGGQGSEDVFLYDRVARTTALVSHAADSLTTGGNGESSIPVISADGRWVAFTSAATDLVSGLPDNVAQVRLFLYDRVSGATTLVSASADIDSGGCGGCGVLSAAISADGRFVAFASSAPDLVPGQQDVNQGYDVFLYDRTTRKTSLVSHAGTPTATLADSNSSYFSMSADGRFIAFNRRPNNTPGGRPGDGDVLLYDRLSATVTPIAPGGVPAISADGGSVAFLSAGRQVFPGQIDANGSGVDVFLYSRAARTIALVSHAAGRPTTTGNGASESLAVPPPFFPLISADGRYVAFFSRATNLVPRQATPGGALFLYDRTSGTVILASRKGGSPTTSSNGAQRATMSADGRFLAFDTLAVDQVPGQIDFNYDLDVFLFDRNTGKTVLVSSRSGAPRGSSLNTGDGSSYSPAISADGSQIAFYGTATNLVAGVRDRNNGDDLFLYTVAARTAAVATLHPPGMASISPDADSFLRGLSADGRWTLFEGSAANLVPGQVDGNGQSDVFLYDHTARKSLLVSHSNASPPSSPTMAGDGPSYQGSLSADGRYVAFTSYATDLDPAVSDYVDRSTTQRRFDVFLFDRVTGKITALSRSARHPGLTGDFDSGKPVISADGRWVAFTSSATDLVPAASSGTGNIYLYDRVAGALTRTNASITTVASAKPLALSADGRYLLTLSRMFGTGHNLFLYDRVTGTNTLVSHDRAGAPAGVPQEEALALSADGRFAVFSSGRADLGSVPGSEINVYLWDREGGGVTLLGGSFRAVRGFAPRQPALSADGRFVVFLSNDETPAPGFDNPGRTDQVVLYDRVAGTSTLVSASALAPGQGSQGYATDPTISPDGRYVAYTSSAPDLVTPGPTLLYQAIYLYDRVAGATIATTPPPAVPNFYAGRFAPLLSADGRSIAFESRSPGLVPRDFNGIRTDVFLFSRTP
jgi:Tol biopolymer transport system component